MKSKQTPPSMLAPCRVADTHAAVIQAAQKCRQLHTKRELAMRKRCLAEENSDEWSEFETIRIRAHLDLATARNELNRAVDALEDAQKELTK